MRVRPLLIATDAPSVHSSPSSAVLRTLVCFAVREEAAPFQKILAADQSRGASVSILITGIGRARAGIAVREFLSAHLPQQVFTCGFAGGLNPALKTGEVLFELPHPTSALHGMLLAAGARPAKFFCADRIATTAAEKQALRAQTGADAVEMESAAIHAMCAARGLACATLRVISDAAEEDLPLDFNALMRPNGNLDFGKLFLTAAASPRKVGALLTLRKKSKFAAEQLAKVLQQVTG